MYPEVNVKFDTFGKKTNRNIGKGEMWALNGLPTFRAPYIVIKPTRTPLRPSVRPFRDFCAICIALVSEYPHILKTCNEGTDAVIPPYGRILGGYRSQFPELDTKRDLYSSRKLIFQ